MLQESMVFLHRYLSIYSIIYQNLNLLLVFSKPVEMSKYTREVLQEMGKDYADAVTSHEIDLFVKYIGQGILKHASLGTKKIYFQLLSYGQPAYHLPNGNLNRYDPGPIPKAYLPEVIKRLRLSFPEFMPGDEFLWVNWS